MLPKVASWSATEEGPGDTQVRERREPETMDTENIHLRRGGISSIKYLGT